MKVTTTGARSSDFDKDQSPKQGQPPSRRVRRSGPGFSIRIDAADAEGRHAPMDLQEFALSWQQIESSCSLGGEDDQRRGPRGGGRGRVAEEGLTKAQRRL